MKMKPVNNGITIEEKADEIVVGVNCTMKVCEDPITGDIVMTYGKGCPKGYVERVAGKIATKGVRFAQESQSDDVSK